MKSHILSRVMRLQMGMFEGMEVYRVGPIKYHFLAKLNIEADNAILFGVFPERVPQYSNKQRHLLNRPD